MSDASNRRPDRSERPEESGDPWKRLPSMAPAAPSAAAPTKPLRRPGGPPAGSPVGAPAASGAGGPGRAPGAASGSGVPARAPGAGRPAAPGRVPTPVGPAAAGPFPPGGRTVAPSPLDPGASLDPHGIHRTLREEFPLTYDPLLRAWVLSRYADVAAALTDERFTHGHRPGDPPCARAHVDVDVEALRAVTERTAYVLARRIAERSQADLVADFCHWLPAGTVAAAVGVPYRDMMRLVRGRAAGALAGECGGQIAVREKALASFLGNVLADPDLVVALRDAPAGLVARAWTESLRRDPPVQIAVRRTGAEVPVSGGVVPAGASVALLVGSAGRDPDRFREPDRFDPFRDDPGQLTYGAGFCPAVLLAGFEAEYALRALFTAMPRLRLADGFRPVFTGLITRAPRSLIVRPGG
ncbi:pulcherriminic acid synthase [Streptomyces sp. PanSC19]|uniref:cytochrome P450 n=1 Tax=Streptomyces sp. PanSC19 TaxID=1520455 RepID=UPI000F95C643|nr:cytochrome P450 [Streptomyces sp. PanSC19]ROQ35082.1 pulcherriminic acid synthase [Streptomyces sp. PanSC19]